MYFIISDIIMYESLLNLAFNTNCCRWPTDRNSKLSSSVWFSKTEVNCFQFF